MDIFKVFSPMHNPLFLTDLVVIKEAVEDFLSIILAVNQGLQSTFKHLTLISIVTYGEFEGLAPH